jgi:hypothetical protein
MALGYSRRVVSGYSVRVIADPVRVAPDGNAHGAVWLATSSSSEGLINAERFLGRTVLSSGMLMFVCWQLQSEREPPG